METNKPKPSLKRVLPIFYDLQEEGYYTLGFDKGTVPDKITIDYGKPIDYEKIKPIFTKAMNELKELGFILTFHVNLAKLSWDDKNLVDGKKLLYQDTPTSVNLDKYQEKTYQYQYQKPKPLAIWSIDIHLDHPADKFMNKIKKFVNFSA